MRILEQNEIQQVAGALQGVHWLLAQGFITCMGTVYLYIASCKVNDLYDSLHRRGIYTFDPIRRDAVLFIPALVSVSVELFMREALDCLTDYFEKE